MGSEMCIRDSIITGPLNPSSQDEDVTVDYEDISDVVFENDF